MNAVKLHVNDADVLVTQGIRERASDNRLGGQLYLQHSSAEDADWAVMWTVTVVVSSVFPAIPSAVGLVVFGERLARAATGRDRVDHPWARDDRPGLWLQALR